ncbi:MAG: ribulokinase, partial [Treponema sp.]|nr:ribulokinase [Treponema sp.]
DYLEVLEASVREAAARAGKEIAAKIRGIAIDTTGSTPCAVDTAGTPLALKKEFAENVSAMFVLWKDHTAVEEARKINECAKTWGGVDYTKYEGGIYSSEWFWAKALRVFREDGRVAEQAASFVEHCDWMTALLTGVTSLAGIRRSRCAMGHKAMWHRSFADKGAADAASIAGNAAAGTVASGTATGDTATGDTAGGYPSADFLSQLDRRLLKVRESLGAETFTSDRVAGHLSAEWAEKLGIPVGIPVAVGAYDAHMGAVGGGVKAGSLVRVMGTSTCDVIVGPRPSGAQTEEPLVRGICGQVDGSVIPGMIGYEAGQSSFGDVYAWFKQILMWPVEKLLPGINDINGIDEAQKNKIAEAMSKKLIPEIEKAAENIDPRQSGLIALDWLNGRRTPDANQLLKGAVTGLSLGTDAVRFYRALVEATAFGARAIAERFREQGVAINEIIGIGGVARKSPLVMQILADVLNMPISIPAEDQAVALGAAMFAATAAGLYPDIPSAQKALCSPIDKIYSPRAEWAVVYDTLYKQYRQLGAFAETLALY